MKTTLVLRPLRWLIVLVFVTLGSVRAADVDSLVRALRDPDRTADAKGEICLQLMDLGPAAAPAVPALIGLLNNQDEMLRDYAVTTLDRIGPAARNALPALRRTAVKDASPEIRELARSAITKISGHAPSSEPVSTQTMAASETESTKPPAPAQPEPAIASPEPPTAQPEAAAAPEVQAAKPPAPVSGYNEAAPVLVTSETPAAEPEAPLARPPETARRPATKGATTTARPALEVHPGRFFRWAVPIGWKGSESANGITLTSPDGLMQVSSALFLGQSGKMTPAEFTLAMLGKLQYRSVQTLAKRDLPDQPSGLDSLWKVQELELSYTISGVPVRGVWTAGILSTDRTYDAYLIGYQSVPLQFERAKLWLATVAHSLALTSPVQSAGTDKFVSGSGGVNYVIKVPGTGNDNLLLPNNRPLDHPALLEIWRGQGHSEDRILKAQRDGMMGYETAKDPQTKRVFEMPLEAWDGAVGGYHNPLRPDEILQAVESGE
jgi:hypothetical protein